MAINTTTTANTTQINGIHLRKIYFHRTTKLPFNDRWPTSRIPAYRKKFISATLKTPNVVRTCCAGIIGSINHVKHKISFPLTTTQYLWPTFCMLITLIYHVQSLDVTTSSYKTKATEPSSNLFHSQLVSTNGLISMHNDAKHMNHSDDISQPFVSKDPIQIYRNVFTASGQFDIFQPTPPDTDTDLKADVAPQHKSHHYGKYKVFIPINMSLSQQMPTNIKASKKNFKIHEAMLHRRSSNKFPHTQKQQDEQHEIYHHKKAKSEHQHVQEQQRLDHQHKQFMNVDDNNIMTEDNLLSDRKRLDELLVDYVTSSFKKGHYEPMPGLFVELQNSFSHPLPNNADNSTRTVRQTSVSDAQVRIDLPRTLQTGRVLFLTGLKKVLWPVFMGLQIFKSLLIAMFIPAIIGSFTKLLGKGISTSSVPLFIRPLEAPQELDFRDNNLHFDEDNKFSITYEGIKDNGPYAYNQPDASHTNNEYVFDPSSGNNQLSYTRLGMNERQHQLMQDSYMSALQSIGSASFKNSGSLSSGSSGLLAPMAKRPPPAANINTFQQFQNVPDSSLLLSNYDPFYSPLLSRLDSVFAQLKINSDKEICREKLICLMYANPAKYAPYSNLVSAQLSRELNELRKPTSDNPDILRFFKYMRAAKDGQDGVDCETTFDKCTEFKDFDNPAMVSTYHDINKLVQARTFSSN